MHAIDGTGKKLFQSIKKLQFIINYLGHINAAIGFGQAAAKRGHKVSYLLNEAFKGEAVRPLPAVFTQRTDTS